MSPKSGIEKKFIRAGFMKHKGGFSFPAGLFNPILLIERPSAKKPPCGGFGGKWEKGRVGLCRIDQAPVFDDEPAVFDDMLDGIDPQMIDQEEIAGDLAQDEIHFLPDL